MLDERGRSFDEIRRQYPDARGDFVSGSSMDRVFRPGSTVVFTSPSAPLTEGEPAAVHIIGEGYTLKRVLRDGDSVILRPDSTDPAWQDDRTLPAASVDYIAPVIHWHSYSW
ncbi:MAG: S24 family peptidase [Coriobacteriia bacterium]|nr:S24 family peptidase [Coriobacteriia bacterium]